MANFQKKMNALMEECQRWVTNNKQVLVVTTTRKEADILAFFFCEKNYLATSCHGLRRPWQKAEICSDFNRKKYNIVFSTPIISMYTLHADVILHFDMYI
jgi:excinuclease UvrABC helicase subunit UvrB